MSSGGIAGRVRASLDALFESDVASDDVVATYAYFAVLGMLLEGQAAGEAAMSVPYFMARFAQNFNLAYSVDNEMIAGIYADYRDKLVANGQKLLEAPGAPPDQS